MFPRGVKYSKEGVKLSAQVLNVPWSGLDVPRGYEIFHGGA